jgi:integrase
MRKLHRLTAKGVDHAKPGCHPDGGNLYLQVTESRAKSWLFIYRLRGRAREMGLGPLHTIGLAEARQAAADNRKLLLAGIDPLGAKRAARDSQALDAARSKTFAECSADYIKAHRKEWSNAKHADQWTNTLATYAKPINRLPVAEVDTALVLRCLEPIWAKKNETASRVRARIEAVLGFATVSGFRQGDNPARWANHLDHLLPAIKKSDRVRHHPALPYAKMSLFLAELRKQEGTAARALEFTVLTAARTSETIGARPEEFDLEKGIWLVPAARMKSRRPHRVPLAPRAVALVREALAARGTYVFSGRQRSKPLSNMAMTETMRRMGYGAWTVHGMRSAFSDWSGDLTAYPTAQTELALAHRVPDGTEAAYRRSDMFEKRRRQMADWQRFCETPAKKGAVLSLRGKTGGRSP